MPATIVIPADRLIGAATVSMIRKLKSGQRSTASMRPLKLASSAKSAVRFPLRSLNETVSPGSKLALYMVKSTGSD